MNQLAKLIQGAKEKAENAEKKVPENKKKKKNEEQSVQLVAQHVYPLNKSQTKHVWIALSANHLFSPIVKISGVKNQSILFNEDEWAAFVDQQGVLTHYFYSTDPIWQPIKVNSKVIEFVTIHERKVIKIRDDRSYEVYLGWETVMELWNKLDVIKYRLKCLSSEEFGHFYGNLITGVADMSGDYKINIMNVLEPLMAINCNNAAVMLEVLVSLPGKVELDVEVAKVFK